MGVLVYSRQFSRLYAYIKLYALEGLSRVLLNSHTQNNVFLIYKVDRCWMHVCNGMECAITIILNHHTCFQPTVSMSVTYLIYDDSAYPYYVL